MSSREGEGLRYPDHLIQGDGRKVGLDDLMNGELSDFSTSQLGTLGICFERTARRAINGPSELDMIHGLDIVQNKNNRRLYSFRYQQAVSNMHENPKVFLAMNQRQEGPVISGEVIVSPNWNEVVLFDASVQNA